MEKRVPQIEVAHSVRVHGVPSHPHSKRTHGRNNCEPAESQHRHREQCGVIFWRSFSETFGTCLQRTVHYWSQFITHHIEEGFRSPYFRMALPAYPTKLAEAQSACQQAAPPHKSDSRLPAVIRQRSLRSQATPRTRSRDEPRLAVSTRRAALSTPRLPHHSSKPSEEGNAPAGNPG